MPAGRPPIPYSDDVALDICEKLATTTMSLESVLDDLRGSNSAVPHLTTIFKWLDENAEFAKMYSRARELQADYMSDLGTQESLNTRMGVVTRVGPRGTETTTQDNVERSKLIVSTIFKRAAQLAPRKYGEKIQQEHSGSVGLTIGLIDDILGDKS